MEMISKISNFVNYSNSQTRQIQDNNTVSEVKVATLQFSGLLKKVAEEEIKEEIKGEKIKFRITSNDSVLPVIEVQRIEGINRYFPNKVAEAYEKSSRKYNEGFN